MIRTRIAQAAAVVAVSLSALVLAPAVLAPSASATVQADGSLGWGG
ncbi:hypothetical protein [Kitasatospora sp. NPDC051914]